MTPSASPSGPGKWRRRRSRRRRRSSNNNIHSLRAPVFPHRRWAVDTGEGITYNRTGAQAALLVGGWLACPAARGKVVPCVAVASVATLR